MVFPGMVYISHPSEYGTLYTRNELERISAVCREFSMPLFLDGARLGYGLMSPKCDITLPELAQLAGCAQPMSLGPLLTIDQQRPLEITAVIHWLEGTISGQRTGLANYATRPRTYPPAAAAPSPPPRR